MDTDGKHTDDADKVLDHLAFRTEVLVVDDNDLCPVLSQMALEPVKAETDEPVLVCDIDFSDLAFLCHLDEFIPVFSLEIQATADIRHDTVDNDTARIDELAQE